MNTCQDFEHHILDLIAGEIAEDAYAELRVHCRRCPDCADIVEFHERLVTESSEIPDPPRRDMQQMRAKVVAGLHSPLKSESVSVRRWWLPVAAMITIFLMGGLVGKFVYQSDQDNWEEALLHQTAATSVEDLLSNRFAYSNVDLQKIDNDTYNVGFDLSTRIRLNLERSSPLLSEVLSQSILSSENTGLRLRNLGYANKMRDPIVRDTLIAVLVNDSNLAVRLKTLSVLQEYPYDSIVEGAILNTLRTDESVQVRLQALDFLANQSTNPRAIIEAIEDTELESDPALQIRAASYEKLNQFMMRSDHF